MFNSGLLILIGVSIANMLMGTLVLLKNSHHRVNIIFFAFVTSVMLWTVANFGTDNTASTIQSLWFARFANVFGLMSIYLFWQFCALHAAHKPAKFILKTIPVLLVGAILSLTPLGVEEITGFDNAAIQKLGPLYFVIVLAMFVSFAGALVSIKNGKKLAKDRQARESLKLIKIGLIVSFSFAVLANIILPIFTNSWNISQFGPIFTLFLISSVALGVIRNSLFDIRPIIARSFGYIFALAFMGLVFGLVTFALLDYLLLNVDEVSPSLRRAIYMSIAIFFGLTFPASKRIFDRLSNKIFYRDAYDESEFIDILTKILVNHTETHKIFTQSADHIYNQMHPLFVQFVVLDQNKYVNISNSAYQKQVGKVVVNEILEICRKNSDPVIVTEELSEPDQQRIRRLLNTKQIASIIKLTDGAELIGLGLIGNKQSGNVFNRQDISVFAIIADELSLALQNSLKFDKIEKFNVILQEEINDATTQLRRTNEKLKALDETKDEFISMASHQLRTPLTSVKGYVSMVLEGDAGELNDQQKKLLSQAFISSQRMNYLISDLLNVSRLRTGKFVIETKPTNLAEVAAQEIDQLLETAAARGLKIVYDKPAIFPDCNLDETKIRQVIMNFLDNAIYYTPDGGEINVEVEANDKRIDFRVIDNGLGVPKKDQHQLFSKFYRADNARRARPDGTGLGLFMAKKVVIAQGGAMIFSSQEGKGSTFGFTFPRSKVEIKN